MILKKSYSLKKNLISALFVVMIAISFMIIEVICFQLIHAELPLMFLAIALAGSSFGLLFMWYRASLQRRALSSLQSLVQRQEVWFATISHEIRTPLNGILGFIRILQQSVLDKEQARQLSLMEKSAQQLKSLVSDVLDFSQFQSGHFNLDSSSFDPENEISLLIDVLKLKAQEKGLSISLEVQGTGGFVEGDVGKFSQIFINLLDNAIKFSSQGGRIQVHLLCEPTGNNQERVKISIEDFGIGISEEEQNQVFEPFFRGRSSADEGVEGAGLGLTIVRELIQAMKGKIHLQSKQGVGSCFTFEFCFPRSKEKNHDNPIRTRNLYSALVAEDNEISQMVIQNFLQKLGYRVDLAHDGQQAIAAARACAYNLVLVDRFMPQMSGFEAAKEIRQIYQENKFNDFHIFGTTADASAECLSHAQSCGVQHLLLKPIDFLELKNLIEQVRAVGGTGINSEKLEVVSQRLGPTTSKQILKLFLQQAPLRRTTILQLKGNNQLPELATFAHNLISSCLAIGATPAAQLCRQLSSQIEKPADELRKTEELSNLVFSLVQELQLCEEQIREQLK